ncbi:MAG: hypothetical protein J6A92_00860 [Lachnospiraceae bacterium]|nr:hypothetical protein [Lachnospiraceae bacterium]
MGELLLCSKELASVPYYIETTALNVYSLEEVCYYLMHNIELIEPGFMDEELCQWIKKELKMTALAERLLKLIREGRSLAEFVRTLAMGCNYCTAEEIQNMQTSLSVFQDKSEIECAKIRADRFLAQGRYSLCVQEYQRLLALLEVAEGSGLLAGNIWHNLGTAYAGQFLFDRAAECYEKAFLKNGNEISLQQANEAKRLADDENLPDMKGLEESVNEQKLLLEKWIQEYKRGSR